MSGGVLACVARGWCSGRCRGVRAGGGRGSLCEDYQTETCYRGMQFGTWWEMLLWVLGRVGYVRDGTM